MHPDAAPEPSMICSARTRRRPTPARRAGDAVAFGKIDLIDVEDAEDLDRGMQRCRVSSGSARESSCPLLKELHLRTRRRWRARPSGQSRRAGEPAGKVSH